MLKKTMTYTDFDGVERTETFYFNLTKAEILNLEMREVGGLQTLIKKIIEEKDNARLIKLFQDLIILSYGEKSPDGKLFRKSPEITEKFTASQAYSDLFIELASNDAAAAAFVNGIVPKEVAEAMAKEQVAK